MLEDNKDIYPDDEFDALYPAVKSAIRNSLVESAFDFHETLACKARNSYVKLGRSALLFVMLGALFTVIEALIAQTFSVAMPHWLSAFFALIVTVGIAIQLFLIGSKMQQKWLNNRFAAERLRSIKFQSFAIAIDALNEEDFGKKVDEFTRSELAVFRQEMNASRALLRSFSPVRAIARIPRPVAKGRPDILAQAKTCYRILRTQYQLQFTADELDRLALTRRKNVFAADICYLVGAICAVLALIVKLGWPDHHGIAIIFDALVAFMFIFGLFLLNWENVSLREESETRFAEYRDELAKGETQAEFIDELVLVERATMEELREFCRSADRVSYRL